MIFTKCDKCGAELEIHENDYMPGCRDTEEAYCPDCRELVAKVFTSGIPSVIVKKRVAIEKEDKK